MSKATSQYIPVSLLSTLQGKGKKRKPDYQFDVIHDALCLLHVVRQLPQPAVIMIINNVSTAMYEGKY